MERTKEENEIILIPSLAYWHLANKGPNQHIHHRDGNCSTSYNTLTFETDGKYKLAKRKRSRRSS